MSEDSLLLEVMQKEFQQVTGVILVIVVDMGEEVVQPLADIDLRQFAASHKGVDDGSVFCSNHESAGNMCVIQSLLATCRNHDINPRLYLNSVIASMPYFDKASRTDLIQLLPHKWKEYHPEAIMETPVRQLAK